MIIKVSPPPNVNGPSVYDRLLRPGTQPPLLVPYCALHDGPVERMQFDVVSSCYSIGIHAQCCGRTSSIRISVDELFRLKRTNEKLYVIVPRGHNQEIRSQAKS